MKFIPIITILLTPSLAFSDFPTYSNDFGLILSIPVSAICLSIAFFISRRAKSPMSFVGVIFITLVSFFYVISIINESSMTFKYSNFLHLLQLSLLLLLIVPFWKLCKFTLKWKEDYSNSGQQSVYAWRKTKESLELKLKENPLEYSIFTNNVINSAYLDLKNGMYFLNLYSSEKGKKTLITNNKFDSIEHLNNYLTNSTKFRLHDFLV